MLRISRVVIISILVVAQCPLWAQNNTNSPYTRYGYGEIANRSFGAGRAMGGVGVGMRSSKQINPMNPASYTSMDSLTFLFDFGVAGQVSWFTDGTNSRRDMNGNIDYFALQFPLSRRIALSAGLLPYSFVGYKFGAYHSEGDAPYTELFIGSGGLNEVYAGASIDIWKKRLSFGLNVGYLFGNIKHQQNVAFSTTNTTTYRSNVNEQRIEVRDVKLDFGLQYTHPFSATERMTVGVTYSPANRLNAKAYKTLTVGDASTGGTVTRDTIPGDRFDIPDSYGFGLSYTKDNKLTIAADATYETWDKVYYFDEKGNFQNRLRIASGVEYIPRANSRTYPGRVKYRAGIHYGNSYQQVNMGNGQTGLGYNEYGASVGFGLPLIDNRSLVNISFEYVKIKPEAKMMVEEQYFRFTINYTFNELWFYKFKMD